MDRHPAVYLLANKPFGTLYVGVTSNLKVRAWEHRSDLVEGFTRKYGIHTLVWYELHSTMIGAITREKQLKHWKRRWKVELILQANPTWRDLYLEL